MDLSKTEEPLYQYYTIVSNNTTEQDEDKPVIYLTFGPNEIEDESQLTQNVVFTNDDTVATDGSNFKVLTFNNGELYVTDNDENLTSVKPELICKDDVLSNDAIEKTDESNEYQEIQLNDGTSAIIGKDLWHSLVENSNAKPQETKKKKKFVCVHQGCGKVYSSAQHLTVHKRTHSGIKPYRCTIEGCEKAFAKRYSLKAHLRTHTGEKPYACNTCIKKFKTSGDLQKHIRTHTGEKPFTCPIEGCGRSFTTSNIRKIHIRSHTGERPYVCSKPMCGKAFASATNYKNHMRIHSGEKPYICSVTGCGKSFTEYSSLYKHNIVHKPYKPFKCNYCGQLCKQENTLKAHKRSIHGVIIMPDGTEVIVKSEHSVIYEICPELDIKDHIVEGVENE